MFVTCFYYLLLGSCSNVSSVKNSLPYESFCGSQSPLTIMENQAARHLLSQALLQWDHNHMTEALPTLVWTRSWAHPAAGTIDNCLVVKAAAARLCPQPNGGCSAGGIDGCSKIMLLWQQQEQCYLRDPLLMGTADLEFRSSSAVGFGNSWPGSSDLLVISWVT